MAARGYGDPEAREFPVQRPHLGIGDGVAALIGLALVAATILVH